MLTPDVAKMLRGAVPGSISGPGQTSVLGL